MTHRAETILNTIETTLTGLTTTGDRVGRGRAWPAESLPALTIDMGEDRLVEDQPITAIDRALTVLLTAHVRSTGNLETEINTIKTEIYAAMKVDRSLGGIAMDLELIVAGQPEIEAESEQPVARCLMQWQVLYRHSETSTEL